MIRTRCGEVYKPVFNPEARRIEASVAAVEPLPFVPAISTLGKAPLGMIHRLQQHPHMRQIELVRRRLRQFVPQRKHARRLRFRRT